MGKGSGRGKEGKWEDKEERRRKEAVRFPGPLQHSQALSPQIQDSLHLAHSGHVIMLIQVGGQVIANMLSS